MSMEILGQRVAELRKQRGIRQDDLAAAVGVSAQAVSKWENGGLPDAELLPKLADYFQVSLDYLFGQNLTDYSDLNRELEEKLRAAEPAEKLRLALEYCWSMEKGVFPIPTMIQPAVTDIDTAETLAKQLGAGDEPIYSGLLADSGFTRMRLSKPLQYFLLALEPEDWESAYLDGVDYPALFRALSDEAVFRAIVRLHRHSASKFTAAWLAKTLEVSPEKATEVLNVLKTYDLLWEEEIDLDDERVKVYEYLQTPTFPALLIFARELIYKPTHYIVNGVLDLVRDLVEGACCRLSADICACRDYRFLKPVA